MAKHNPAEDATRRAIARAEKKKRKKKRRGSAFDIAGKPLPVQPKTRTTSKVRRFG